MTMTVESAVVSHEGRIRENNEDNFFLNGVYKKNTDTNREQMEMIKKGDRFLFSVCDGMGGEDYGELASFCTVRTMKELWRGKITFEQFLNATVTNIRVELQETSSEDSGTTATILLLKNEYAQLFHIGDSRMYLFRKNLLLQVSKDHTHTQLMIDHGILDAGEARIHKGRHTLTRYIGLDMELSADDFYRPEPLKLSRGDIFLLCSDGLTDMLTDDVIETCIRDCQKKNAKILAKTLVKLALEAGGKDNITCLIVKIKELEKDGIWNRYKYKEERII